MIKLSMRPFLIAVAVLTSCAAQAAEQVEMTHAGEPLRGVLFRPHGAGPFPAVVALHGCGGLTDRTGRITRRFAEWGVRLSSAGFVVLFPDSFGSRGLKSQCRVKKRSVRASHERVADANVARRWLQSQDWVIHDRISLIGWSNGASAALWTVQSSAKSSDGAGFHRAVALYPGCRELQKSAWTARVPTLLLVGAMDDWTPALPCQQMLAAAQGRGASASIVTYPGAYHGFDAPDSPLRLRTGVANSADGSGKVHTGTNAPARADALKRLPEWLAQ